MQCPNMCFVLVDAPERKAGPARYWAGEMVVSRKVGMMNQAQAAPARQGLLSPAQEA